MRRLGLSLAEFSKRTGIGFRRVQRMIDAGEIKVVRMGGVWRIPDAELARILGLFEVEEAADRERQPAE